MMLAEVPAALREAAAWLGAIGVVIAGLAAVVGLFTKSKPFRWLGRTLVSDPMSRWFQAQINQSTTGRLVAYHLGPNGTTPALHTRLARLEVRALLDEWDHPLDLTEDVDETEESGQ